jgi:hypothetical protein
VSKSIRTIAYYVDRILLSRSPKLHSYALKIKSSFINYFQSIYFKIRQITAGSNILKIRNIFCIACIYTRVGTYIKLDLDLYSHGDCRDTRLFECDQTESSMQFIWDLFVNAITEIKPRLIWVEARTYFLIIIHNTHAIIKNWWDKIQVYGLLQLYLHTNN